MAKKQFMVSPEVDRAIREIRRSGAITEADVLRFTAQVGKHRHAE